MSRAEAISIHAPREGSDIGFQTFERIAEQFLSTLPARGATTDGSMYYGEWIIFLSTLPARGATLTYAGMRRPRPQFLSTLPARGATAGALPGKE